MAHGTTEATATENSRQLADFFVILTGMSLLGLALYGGSVVAGEEGREIRYGQIVWLVYFVTGTIALIASGLAQWERYQTIARIILALNGVALLGGLVAFNSFGWRALTTVALPGVLFIVLSRFLGPLRRAVPREHRVGGRASPG